MMRRYRFRRADVEELAYIMGVPPEQITRADIDGYNRWLRRCAGSSLRRTFMPLRPLVLRARLRGRAIRGRRATRRTPARSPGRRRRRSADDDVEPSRRERAT
jgi:hypothetical protein